jgi:hypothetical protein
MISASVAWSVGAANVTDSVALLPSELLDTDAVGVPTTSSCTRSES